MEETLSLKIDSPDKVIWNGVARSISSINSQGPFDILAHHVGFITIVENQPIKIITEVNKPLVFKFKTAVIFVLNNVVSVYTNI